MFKFWCAVGVALGSLLSPPAWAGARAYENDMASLWEVLWHQSGAPTRLVRWEQDMRVRLHGVDLPKHREQTLAALRAVTADSGVRVTDVSNLPDAVKLANVDIEILPNSALEANQPCVTVLNYSTETKIDSATVQMRTGDAKRCAHHELMHVMGLRGHPSGNTVLSYFAPQSNTLLPLDRAMLRAWYSDRARGGMTPFEILPVMAEELGTTLADQGTAAAARARFYTRTVEQMRAFVEGQGDAPAILKKSGKTTDQGLKFGRVEMGYFLGVAYQQGSCVAADASQSAQWLQRAATMGNRSALARLSAAPK